MKQFLITTFLSLFVCLSVSSQTVLTYEGQTYIDTNTPVSYGINVPRSVPTLFTFRNNSVTSVNLQGYMIQAGDEGINAYNNNLDGEQIIGNKFNWNGDFSGLVTAMTITHGLFTGCNIDVGIKYNYLNRVPMGIIRKSASNMVNNTGGVSYNILKTFNVGGVVKGMSGVKWYNNTFYQDRPQYSSVDPTLGTWRGCIDIYTNTDVTPNSVSHGTKVKNNIFYTKYKTYALNIMDTESLIDFESDYNVYWCEEGDHTPVFNVAGSYKTWDQWRAMGYDQHSVVMNPNFIDFVNFVPTTRLNYGTDLGTEFNLGLSTTADWIVGSNPALTYQNGTWQVGARIYAPVDYLYVSTHNLTIPAAENSTAKFNIISNTDWTITTSQPWLTVSVQLYWSTIDSLGTKQQWVSMAYSGSAPDLGAFEYLPSTASGHDTAIVTLQADANIGSARTATVTISGTNVANQVINVTQEGTTAISPFYISSTGSDTEGNGTITSPWGSLNKAWDYLQPGDTLYVRGGTYVINSPQYLIDKSGTAIEPIRILAYQNEKPIIQAATGYAYEQGIVVEDCSFIHIRGLEIKGFTQIGPDKWGNGIWAMDVTDCVFENLDVHHNCFGMSLGDNDGITTRNLIYNCDFHHNEDPITDFPPPYDGLVAYSNADGLTIRCDLNGVGTENYVIGCRFWYNSDDGIDLWSNEGLIVIKDSWAFLNGYYFDTTNRNPGEGNGFKLGRQYISQPDKTLRKIYNCVAWNNPGWGFLRNGAMCNMEIYNNTAYQNGTSTSSWSGGFFFGDDGTFGNIPFYIKNNIAYNNKINFLGTGSSTINNSNNTWDSPVTVSDADFISLISSELLNPRNSDGSLPKINFLNLASGSDLISSGIYVGIPFLGINPDMGAFEFNESLPIIVKTIVSHGYVITSKGNKMVSK